MSIFNQTQPSNPIDEAERVILAQSGTDGLRTVAAFLHALPSDATLTWHDDVCTPANVLAMELEARTKANFVAVPSEATEDKPADPKNFAPGSFGCHEAMHMAHVLAEMVDERLCQHPAVMLKPEWGELAEQACAALHQLYQDIAQEHMA